MKKKASRFLILKYLSENRSRLLREFSLERIALIGSIARDEYSDESDVDIIVKFQTGTQRIYEQKSRLIAELEREFGRSVEIGSEKYLKPYYRTEILREAVYV